MARDLITHACEASKKPRKTGRWGWLESFPDGEHVETQQSQEAPRPLPHALPCASAIRLFLSHTLLQ